MENFPIPFLHCLQMKQYVIQNNHEQETVYGRNHVL